MATFEIDEKRFDIIKEAVSPSWNGWNSLWAWPRPPSLQGAHSPGSWLMCRCSPSSSLQYMRSLNNFRAEQPHQHAMYYLRLLMTEVAWTKDELKDALDGEGTSAGPSLSAHP